MRTAPTRSTAVLATIIAIPVLTLIPVSVGVAGGLDTTTTAPATTTSAPVTTTTAAPTTTTSAPVTTTTAPTTTTTHARSTTTSHPTSTTTTTKPPAHTSSSTPWGWIVLAVVVVLAVILVALLLARSRRQGRVVEWERSVGPAVAAAEIARDLVLSQTPEDPSERRASVGVQMDDAAAGLERAAAAAPDEVHAGLCARCAESLRGLAFAVEADHLLRSGGQNPTGEQLASADLARRNRTAELEGALRELKVALVPKK